MRSLNTFVWRGLVTHRLRTILSILAAALGGITTSSLLVNPSARPSYFPRRRVLLRRA
jgi:hypothetical protein